jgi:hypothetical protein
MEDLLFGRLPFYSLFSSNSTPRGPLSWEESIRKFNPTGVQKKGRQGIIPAALFEVIAPNEQTSDTPAA